MTELRTSNLCKQYGGINATDNISLAVESNSLHGIIGPNGAGKTTLIAQLSGQLLPDTGSVFLDDKNITKLSMAQRCRLGITRTFQITSVFPQLSTLENVTLAVQAGRGRSFKFWSDIRFQAELLEQALECLETVNLRQRACVRAENLSHGEKRQLEIAMAIATKPKVLLLDEPMAGMSADESNRMSQLINQLKGSLTIVLVEHDMDIVFSLADTISVLVYGKLVASASPETVRDDPLVIEAYLGSDA